ncbi:MAG: hypothetical protein SynsKO_34510 [Synoicihabitans sp.]
MRSWGPVKGEISTPQGDFGWRENLSPARTEAGGTAMNGKFYVLGGIDSLAQTFSDLQIFDPATNSWQRGKDFPRPINHAGVVADENHLYAVGGFGPLGIRIRGFMFARWDPYDNLERYDPATDQWEALPPMPEPRGAGGVTLGEGKIWYVGGIDAERNLSASLFCYDIASATWSVKPPMKYPRDHMRMEYVDGALYAISGREDDMRFNLAHVEKFDLATETWSELPPLPTPRGGFASAVLDGKIYTFGGESVWTCFETIEAFDTRTNQWETMPPLPEPRHGILAGVIGENIHLVSGGRHPRVSISGLHRTFTPRTTAP